MTSHRPLSTEWVITSDNQRCTVVPSPSYELYLKLDSSTNPQSIMFFHRPVSESETRHGIFPDAIARIPVSSPLQISTRDVFGPAENQQVLPNGEACPVGYYCNGDQPVNLFPPSNDENSAFTFFINHTRTGLPGSDSTLSVHSDEGKCVSTPASASPIFCETDSIVPPMMPLGPQDLNRQESGHKLPLFSRQLAMSSPLSMRASSKMTGAHKAGTSLSVHDLWEKENALTADRSSSGHGPVAALQGVPSITDDKPGDLSAGGTKTRKAAAKPGAKPAKTAAKTKRKAKRQVKKLQPVVRKAAAPRTYVRRPKGQMPCWTCRVRRKACDGRHPVCAVCVRLGLPCHYSTERPVYMTDPRANEQRRNELMVIAIAHKASQGSPEQKLAAPVFARASCPLPAVPAASVPAVAAVAAVPANVLPVSSVSPLPDVLAAPTVSTVSPVPAVSASESASAPAASDSAVGLKRAKSAEPIKPAKPAKAAKTQASKAVKPVK